MKSLAEYIKVIEGSIVDHAKSKEPRGLYDPIEYSMSLGGKRVRPALLMMANALFDGEDSDAVSAALAVEIFHNFTLVHDDIMDDAPLRRGQATVYKKWGVNTSILAGDVMFVQAYELLVKNETQALLPIIKLFNKTAIEVCEGQQYDMDFETRTTVSIDEYLKMIELKTAVLVAASLEIGALIGGASKQDAHHLYEFGRNLGVAFQLMDDILDLYGNPEKFGKRVGGDVIANKKTYLLIKAQELATGSLQKELEFCLSSTALQDEAKVDKVRSIFDQLNIKKLAEDEMTLFYNTALSHLDSIEADSSKKMVFEEFAKNLMNREN